MHSLHFYNHGSTDELVYGELPDPTPGDGEVTIQVGACALNHLDIWVLRGWNGLKIDKPHIGGSDIAGTISEIGQGVTGWNIGERVVVCPGYYVEEDKWTKSGQESVSKHYRIIGESRRGGFCGYTNVPAYCLKKLPENFNFIDAASSLLVSVTAWRMLKHRANVQPGESVLIVGAGGGLNSFSIQVAKHLGAEVVALTSSDEKSAKAKELGATHVINYKTNPDWSRAVRKVCADKGANVIVDNVGASTFSESIHAAARGGRIVTVGNTSGPMVTFDNRLVFAKQLSILGSTMGSFKDFDEVTELIFDGTLKPIVDKTFALKEGKKAYEYLMRGNQFGKVVITP